MDGQSQGESVPTVRAVLYIYVCGGVRRTVMVHLNRIKWLCVCSFPGVFLFSPLVLLCRRGK